jgi:hypothetical protein
MKRMDDLTSEKAAMAVTTQAMDSRMTRKVCGDTGHLGNYCPPPRRMWCTWTATTMVIVHKEVKRGTNHTLIIREVIKVILSTQTNPPWKICFFGKAKINDSLIRKKLPMIRLWKALMLKLIAFLLHLRTKWALIKRSRPNWLNWSLWFLQLRMQKR